MKTPSDTDDLLTFLDDTFSGGHEIRFCATHEPVGESERTEERDGATIVWVDEPPSINEFGDSARQHECLSDALRAWYRRDGISPSEGVSPSEGSAPDTPTEDEAEFAATWARIQDVPPSAPDTKPDERMLPLARFDGTDWSHDVRADRVRIGRIEAPRLDWIAALERLAPVSSSPPEGEDTQRLDWLEARARERHSVKIEHTYAWTEHGDYGTILSSGPEEFWLHEDQTGQSLRSAIDSARAAIPTQEKQ